MTLPTITGEVVCLGDLAYHEAVELSGLPRITLKLADGRFVTLAGLTQDECRACAPVFLRQAVIKVGEP